jgi:subtilisin family serine protease
MNIINVCSTFSRFAIGPGRSNERLPLIEWKEEWKSGSGRGIVAGLLDTDFDENIPDLTGADRVVRNFSGCKNRIPQLMEHGTYSVATLIGQGNYQIRGIVPQTRLLVAKVIGADGVATPQSVAKAIEWLIANGARVIILPLGEAREHQEISLQLEKGSADGVVFFAAAGNYYPDPLVFPARHPMAIAVGAADVHGNLLHQCSRQPRLDLVAPGWKMPAPIRGRLVRRRGGSSIACVLAAGVAILLLSSGVFQSQSLNRTRLLAYLQRKVLLPPPCFEQEAEKETVS